MWSWAVSASVLLSPVIYPCYISRRYLLWSQNTPNPAALTNHSLIFSWRSMWGFCLSVWAASWKGGTCILFLLFSFLSPHPTLFFLVLQQPYWDVILIPGAFPLQVCNSVAFTTVMKLCKSLKKKPWQRRNHDKVSRSTPVTPAHGRQRQESCEFEASLYYILRLCLKPSQIKPQHNKDNNRKEPCAA